MLDVTLPFLYVCVSVPLKRMAGNGMKSKSSHPDIRRSGPEKSQAGHSSDRQATSCHHSEQRLINFAEAAAAADEGCAGVKCSFFARVLESFTAPEWVLEAGRSKWRAIHLAGSGFRQDELDVIEDEIYRRCERDEGPCTHTHTLDTAESVSPGGTHARTTHSFVGVS